MARPKVFIGSATSRLQVASTLQARLERDFEVTVWDQGVVRPSDYPLPALLQRCSETDFAIQIIAPDVIQKETDGTEVFAPNPNVLIEIGLFMGALGQRRVILVAPSSFDRIEMPSNLLGLTIVPYDAERSDHNLEAAVGSAAHKVRTEFMRQWPDVLKDRLPWHKVKMFQELDGEFQQLVRSAAEFQSCYVHSRRWRETYGDMLRGRMDAGHLEKATFYLPDVRDSAFIRALSARFDDGPSIPAMLLNAYRWVDELIESFGARVQLRVYNKVPAYSFYMTQETAIVAFYTLAIKRKPVPAIEAHKDDAVWAFLVRDLSDFTKECELLPQHQVKSIADDFERHSGLSNA